MMIIDEAEQPQVHGFPVGYFVIRSLACNRVFDVLEDSVEDGTEIALWAEKDSSLVESMHFLFLGRSTCGLIALWIRS
jgi:hypothetical protein